MQSEIYKKAFALAKEKHEGQKYGDKKYFDHHVIGVLNLVNEQLDLNSDIGLTPQMFDIFQCVALLHDTVEDSDITVEEIRKEFGDHIADAVYAITKKDEEDYNKYLMRVLVNPISLFVKLQDIKFNLKQVEKEIENGGKADSSEDKLYRLRNKYLKADGFLRINTLNMYTQ